MCDRKSESQSEKKTDGEKTNPEPPKPNKSTLHALLGNTKLVSLAEDEDKPSERTDGKSDGEKKPQKNVSTLYKIISSQNVIFKKPEEGQGNPEEEGIEYEDIIENQHFEKENQMSIAENAIYYVEEGKESPKDNSNRKKSTLEITVTSPNKDRSKRAQSAIEAPKSYPIFSIRKTNSTDVPSDLGDFSGIRFSFLDGKPEKNRDFIYDTIDESNNLKIHPEDCLDSSENPYSSPRPSLNSRSHPHQDYVAPDNPDRSDDDSELFYAASEVLNLPPPTPHKPRKDSSDYEDLDLENEKLPDIPRPDDYADVDANDYCRHRDLNRNKLSPRDSRTILRVRSKINRAWKSMKSWINDEREAREANPPRTRVEAIEVVRECDVRVAEAATDAANGSVSPVSEAAPVFRFSNENVNFLEVERRENSPPDSGTYVDMTRSVMSESAGDLLSTLLRKKREGNAGTPSFRKSRCYPEVSGVKRAAAILSTGMSEGGLLSWVKVV